MQPASRSSPIPLARQVPSLNLDTSRTASSPNSGKKVGGPRRTATPPSSVGKLLDRARRRLTRVTAEEAAAEQIAGALLVDTRTLQQRTRDGEIPAALVIDRTVLEWRLDPGSPSRIPEAKDHKIRVIVICAEGYSSSLAAASLQDLGLVNATDVIGGFEAWEAAGLPVTR